jgi:hypothetical protein
VKLPMLSDEDKLAEIRRLYFTTSRATIDADLAKALDLLKALPSEEQRERATVYMEGLAQMRSDWAKGAKGAKDEGQRARTGQRAEGRGQKRRR